jgi:hypothetical protein
MVGHGENFLRPLLEQPLPLWPSRLSWERQRRPTRRTGIAVTASLTSAVFGVTVQIVHRGNLGTIGCTAHGIAVIALTHALQKFGLSDTAGAEEAK